MYNVFAFDQHTTMGFTSWCCFICNPGVGGNGHWMTIPPTRTLGLAGGGGGVT